MTKDFMKESLRIPKPIFGVCINDTGMGTERVIDGVVVRCPFYSKWKSMLSRVFDNKKFPTYFDKSIVDDWQKLSKFKSWMADQVWEGLELDKDILVEGNKIYGPDTCCFVPARINTMMALGASGKTKYPFGVGRLKGHNGNSDGRSKPYIGRLILTTEEGKKFKCLGYSSTAMGAHKLWQLAKANAIEESISWYVTQHCFRTDVADALMARVWRLRTDAAYGIETKSL